MPESGSKFVPWDPNILPVKDPNLNDEPINFGCVIADSTYAPTCSASVISLHFVVTSCLCLQRDMMPLPPDNVRVIVGDFYNKDRDDGIELAVYPADDVVLQPGCFLDKQYHLKYDIGLVKTSKEIEFGSTLGIATIPSEKGTKPNINRNWIISAFQPKNTIATTLRDAVWFVKSRNVDPKLCTKVLNDSFYDDQHNYCASYHHSHNKDYCPVDYGASLSIDKTLIGILIQKFGCGRKGSAASFVDVALSRDWLDETVQKLTNGEESV